MTTSPRHVSVYLLDLLSGDRQSGTRNRVVSNVAAYRELGFEVEIVHLEDQTIDPGPVLPLEGVSQCRVPISPPGRDRLFQLGRRAAYRLGWPAIQAIRQQFKAYDTVRSEAVRREATRPGQIHHFEYLSTACAAVDLDGLKCVWSHHDVESRFRGALLDIRAEVEDKRATGRDLRELRRMRSAERRAAAHCRLILCIARHEADSLRREWPTAPVEHFPMSVPDEDRPGRTRNWVEGNTVRLLHVGRIDGLASYRSLEFLFDRVFPLLEKDLLDRVELDVVGSVPGTRRADEIQRMARRYAGVHFHGFQDDVRRFYAASDLQVVGSSEATGLRTRIVESFAFGAPVLSTRVGAEGVDGLVHRENILLADTPQEFAEAIRAVAGSPGLLDAISLGGRELYDRVHGRRAVSRKLGGLLDRYQLV